MPNSIVNQCRRPARRRWLIPTIASAFVAALCGGVLTTPSVVMAGDAAEPSADAQLAELFAPVVALRSQSSECGEGEPYYPVPVDVLFGRDDVVIRDATGDVLVQGPTIDDLADLDADSWIDIPGDALRPGCDYEQWFDALEAPPTVYARVVHDPEASQPIVVQYWFFYTYNDWNDRHEGDWEMVQVGFDESTVEAAISAGPSVYAFAQHEGAEVAEAWRREAHARRRDASGRVPWRRVACDLLLVIEMVRQERRDRIRVRRHQGTARRGPPSGGVAAHG